MFGGVRTHNIFASLSCSDALVQDHEPHKLGALHDIYVRINDGDTKTPKTSTELANLKQVHI